MIGVTILQNVLLRADKVIK